MLKGQDKKDYQRSYMKDYMRNRRLVKTPLLRPVKTPLRPTVKTQDKTDREAKLEKAGLTVGKNGLLDLTGSTRRPLQEESNSRIPVYNPAIHKAGDRVLVQRGKRMVETIIPVLDAGGQAVPEYD